MDNVHDDVASRSLESLVNEMHDKEYRDQYVESFSRQLLARQMRGFRGDKSQAEYGLTLDKSQTQVARFEDPTYGWQTRTVFEVARKQNVAAIICFVDFGTFLRFEESMSEDMLTPQPYDASKVDAEAKEIARAGTWRAQPSDDSNKPPVIRHEIKRPSVATSIISINATGRSEPIEDASVVGNDNVLNFFVDINRPTATT